MSLAWRNSGERVQLQGMHFLCFPDLRVLRQPGKVHSPAWLAAQVVPLLTLALRGRPSEPWRWSRASGALATFACWSDIQRFASNATLLACLHGLGLIPAIAESVQSSPFFDDGILWVLSGNIGLTMVVDICCIPSSHIQFVYRSITIAKMILLARVSSLPIAWIDTLPTAAPHMCVQLGVAALLLLRRQHHRNRLLAHQPSGLLVLGRSVEQGEEEESTAG